MVNQYCTHSFARKWQMPFLNQQERMTTENISWSLSTKEWWQPGRCPTHNLLITNWATEAGILHVIKPCMIIYLFLCMLWFPFKRIRARSPSITRLVWTRFWVPTKFFRHLKKTNMFRKIFLFYHKIVCCVYSLEFPHWGNSNEYTQHTTFV